MSKFRNLVLNILNEADINFSLRDLPGEEWRDIPEYNNEYQVSNMGRIKSLGRYTYRIGSNKPIFIKEKILKPTKGGHITLKNNYQSHVYNIGRLVLQAFKPEEFEADKYIMHKDNDISNNKLDNLFFISDKDIEEIRNLYKTGQYTATALANKYNVDRKKIWQITSNIQRNSDDLQDLPGEEWKDIPGYEGSYQISNMGRIKSLERYVPSRYNQTRHIPEKILSRNYEVSNFYKNNPMRLSRLVLQAFKPNEFDINDPNMLVIHKDGNILNNRLDNLFIGNHSDQQLNSIKNGTANFINNKYGERKVKCIETGQIFDSITNAAKWLNVDPSQLNVHLRKRLQYYTTKDGTKKPYSTDNVKGYHFEYINN